MKPNTILADLKTQDKLTSSPLVTNQYTADVEVTFGIPSKNCQGFGICHVKALSKEEFSTKKQQLQARKALATLTLTATYDLCLVLYTSTIHPDIVNAYLQKGIFCLPETLWLQSATIWQSAKDVPKTLGLLTGKYPIVVDAPTKDLKIHFKNQRKYLT